MYKNYFFLNRLAKEIDCVLSGSMLAKCFAYEKQRLIFSFETETGEDIALECCLNPQVPYVVFKEGMRIPKKNFLRFFEKFLPAKLLKISIAYRDRILQLCFESFSIFVLIRGARSNILLLAGDLVSGKIPADDNDVPSSEWVSYRTIDDASANAIQNELRETQFRSDFFCDVLADEILEEISIDKLVNGSAKHPLLGKEILAELFYRARAIQNELPLEDALSPQAENPRSPFQESLRIILQKISSEQFTAADSNGDTVLIPRSFHSGKPKSDLGRSFLAVYSDFIKNHFRSEVYSQLRKRLYSFFETHTKKLTAKKFQLEERIRQGCKDVYYEECGNLLLINLYLMKKGDEEISIEDVYNDGALRKIRLQKTKTPQENAKHYFERSKDERESYQKSILLLEFVQKQLDKFVSYQSELETISEIESEETSMTQLEKLKNFYKPFAKKMNKQQEGNTKDSSKAADESRFRNFTIDGKFRLYVGRDSRNNDELTMHFAKQNDYWFHARSVSGSHVVLRVDNSKENVPKDILKKAASVTAYYSKAKTAGVVPVSYTLKKYVVKKKGMAPGKVALMKEEVLLVKPEIPAGVLPLLLSEEP